MNGRIHIISGNLHCRRRGTSKQRARKSRSGQNTTDGLRGVVGVEHGHDIVGLRKHIPDAVRADTHALALLRVEEAHLEGRE